MNLDKRKCSTCEYSNPCWSDRLPCLFCNVWCGEYKEWRPKVETSDLIEMYKIKQRAEKDYINYLRVHANNRINAHARNAAYIGIWALSRALGYSEEKVENDMNEAEKRK